MNADRKEEEQTFMYVRTYKEKAHIWTHPIQRNQNTPQKRS